MIFSTSCYSTNTAPRRGSSTSKRPRHPMSIQSEVTVDRPNSTLFSRIQKSPYICSNCFSTTKAEAVELRSRRDSIDSILGTVWLAGEGAGHDRLFKNAPPGCDQCGIFSVMETGRRGDSPLTKRQALNRAVNLSQTLIELWIAHDAEVLIRTVKRRKETPSSSPKDDDNFAIAVRRALRK